MTLTDTKAKRLAIIIAVVVVVFAASFAARFVSRRSSESEVRSLSRRVEARFGAYDRARLERMLADDSIAGWEGRASAPFRVDGHDPQIRTEVRAGYLVRYRIGGLGSDHCVDAIWPTNGRFRVTVTNCHGYQPPPGLHLQ